MKIYDHTQKEPYCIMPKKDLKNYAYDVLRNRIVNCIYPPSSILNEAQLAAEFGISRTPIREAISRLENEGFIQIVPKKGIFVTSVSLTDVRQIFQARIAIEPIAVKMAGPNLPHDELRRYRACYSGEEPDIYNAFRADTEMHLFIIRHCGNRFIIEMMEKVFDVNTRVIISSKQNQCQIHDARKEHIKVLDLILDGNYDEAASFMEEHVKNCEKAALQFFYKMNYTDQISTPIQNF